MSDGLRPQDRWNQKKGFVSKSYKLNQTIISLFANACERNNVTQAGQLTKLMSDYSVPIGRRESIMFVQEKYYSNENYQNILQSRIEASLAEITDEDIGKMRRSICKYISTRSFYSKISDVLEYNKEVDCRSIELMQYFELGAIDIVQYITQKCIKEIVYFNLVNEGVLMPLTIRHNSKVEININHAHGNSLFDIYLDMLPYESFAVVKKNFIS